MDELFATIHAILVAATAVLFMFLFTTLFNRDISIYHFATRWTQTYLYVCTIMIKVRAFICSIYHILMLSLQPKKQLLKKNVKFFIDGFESVIFGKINQGKLGDFAWKTPKV